MGTEKLINIFIFCVVAAILFSIALAPGIHFSSTHEGTHTGYITAIEQEGYFFPNYRVYFKTDTSSSQEDMYCMDRKHGVLAELMKGWSRNRTRVTITYDGVRAFGFGLCRDIEITKATADAK